MDTFSVQRVDKNKFVVIFTCDTCKNTIKVPFEKVYADNFTI